MPGDQWDTCPDQIVGIQVTWRVLAPGNAASGRPGVGRYDTRLSARQNAVDAGFSGIPAASASAIMMLMVPERPERGVRAPWHPAAAIS